MPSRKLVFYIHGMVGGGAERVFALLTSALANRGHAVTLVNDFSARDNMLYLDSAVRVVTVGRNHIRAIWRLANLLKRETPNVVFTALGASNLKMTCASILAGRRSALVRRYHGYFAVESRPLGRFGYMATPVITRIADRTLAVSSGLADYLVRTWRAPRGRVSYIHNPIFASGMHGDIETEHLSDRSDVILAVGRLAPEKDFASLIQAFALLIRPGCRLVILGEGPERQALEAEINRLGLAGRVSLPGYVAEPWPYFRQARCFALTSTLESFGNVVVEALAHGLPVVATRCGGPEEILEHGRFGTLVPVGDIAAIAAALDSALANPGDPQPRRERAAAFSIEAVTTRYEALVESVMAVRQA